MKKIWLSPPHMGQHEIEFVNNAFKTNWIAPLGPNVDGFEEDISNYINDNSKDKVSTAVLSSGTAALHLSLVMLGVRQNDAVIVQSFTFCGSTNPVNYQGAEVVFVDSEIDTWNIDPEVLKKSIEDLLDKGYGIPDFQKPKKGKGLIKAIVLVHLYGMPAKMTEIEKISKEFHIPIIEDAAEALGSSYKKKKCGNFGKISILSFNGNKIITTSGGGALLSKNSQYVEKAKFLSTQARDIAPHYQHSEIGYNYRMSNVIAGIGRGQMKVLPKRVDQRRKNNLKYQLFFKKTHGVSVHSEPNTDFYSNYWLTTILIDPEKTGGINREDIRLEMEKENIECRPLWKPMHLQPVYKGSKFYGVGLCEKLFDNGLCLPSGSDLTENDFDRIFTVLSRFFK